jgi:hypothetical protein
VVKGCLWLQEYVSHFLLQGLCLMSIQPSEPQIPANVSVPTFSQIFGTNMNAFELIVPMHKIMGPCWLQIKKPHVEYKRVRALE